MGYGTPDVCYQPEAFDLVPVAEIDYSDECYCFDTRIVWRHTPTGTLYTARDAGCSCPSPFEDYTSLDDLDVFDLDTILAEVEQEVVHAAMDEVTQYAKFTSDIISATQLAIA